LLAIQKEIHRHDFSYFVDEPPSVAQGGKGVVVSGVPGVQEKNQYDGPIPGPSDK
jgi:alanine dehydrogenase